MNTKVCFKCNREKPLNDFYKHPMMEDGHLNKCKDCAKEDAIQRWNKKMGDEDWHEKEKSRHREKYHRLKYKTKHKATTEQRRISTSKYKSKYPERYKANNVSQHLVCPKNCHRHHWSYNQEHWKDTIIFSIEDHRLLHRNMIYDQTIFMFRNSQGEVLNTKQSHLDLLQEIKNDSNH